MFPYRRLTIGSNHYLSLMVGLTMCKTISLIKTIPISDCSYPLSLRHPYLQQNECYPFAAWSIAV